MRNLRNLKKTIHLIYPFDLKKKINPWAIGNNISLALKNNFLIKSYYWTSLEKINPRKGDILIGHCNPNPFTVFRRSIKNKNWEKKILIQPYNEDPKQMSHLYDVMKDCDYFLAICGEYWFKRIGRSKFRSWKKKMIQLDLGLHISQYPFIKNYFNKTNDRKFLYIGNDYAYNNFSKNLSYLKEISNIIGAKKFGSVGNKVIGKIKHYGWLNLQTKKSLEIIKKYDFLIQTSKHDANPSTVLEAMAWGIIPIITKECGYKKEKSIINIPLNNKHEVKRILNKFQVMSEDKLKELQRQNYDILKKFYNWNRFQATVKKIIFEKKKSKKIYYKRKEINFFKKNLKDSPNYYLNIGMILIILKSNLKIFITKVWYR